MPSQLMRLAAFSATARAAAIPAPVPTTASTRPPFVLKRPPASRTVPGPRSVPGALLSRVPYPGSGRYLTGDF
ncbi:MAG: hypothetical protein ABSB75_00585, partial [Candidatus Limnocylindrales bacterium]